MGQKMTNRRRNLIINNNYATIIMLLFLIRTYAYAIFDFILVNRNAPYKYVPSIRQKIVFKISSLKEISILVNLKGILKFGWQVW